MVGGLRRCVRDGHVEDDDAGRESIGWVTDSRALRRAEVLIVMRIMGVCLVWIGCTD